MQAQNVSAFHGGRRSSVGQALKASWRKEKLISKAREWKDLISGDRKRMSLKYKEKWKARIFSRLAIDLEQRKAQKREQSTTNSSWNGWDDFRTERLLLRHAKSMAMEEHFWDMLWKLLGIQFLSLGCRECYGFNFVPSPQIPTLKS